ncbi:hypothetical protein V8C86DRAFT_1699028 [Haematococcus lacustris]
MADGSAAGLWTSKLQQSWSVHQIVSTINQDRLQAVQQPSVWQALDNMVKVRILLGCLLLPPAELANLQPEIRQLAASSSQNDDDWVRVVQAALGESPCCTPACAHPPCTPTAGLVPRSMACSCPGRCPRLVLPCWPWTRTTSWHPSPTAGRRCREGRGHGRTRWQPAAKPAVAWGPPPPPPPPPCSAPQHPPNITTTTTTTTSTRKSKHHQDQARQAHRRSHSAPSPRRQALGPTLRRGFTLASSPATPSQEP